MSDKARQICGAVRKLVRYKPDPNNRDVWQSPATTEKLRTGDCEDFAILILSRCRKAKVKATMVVCYSRKGGHAVVAGDGWYASNAVYFRTTNLARSVQKECRWPNIHTIVVTDLTLRKKGVRV